MSYVKIGNVEIGNNPRMMLLSVIDSASGSVARREVSFAGFDGSSYFDISYKPRGFTVQGAIFGSSAADLEAQKIMLTNACDCKSETDVYYFNGAHEYYAKAFPSQLPKYTKKSNTTCMFSVTLDICGFYWLSPHEIVNGVFERSDNLYGTFTLPRPFTKRSQGAKLINGGSVPVPPVFEITTERSLAARDITITNESYSSFIKLQSYAIAANEIITIDCSGCTAESTVNGNIVKYISDDSSFFMVELGENSLICNDSELTVKIRWRERFLGV